MDNWGDPWADNVKSPTKDTVVSSPPPTQPHAPVLLNGFLDDAGWGNDDDDGFGDWASPSTNEVQIKDTHESRLDAGGDSQWGSEINIEGAASYDTERWDEASQDSTTEGLSREATGWHTETSDSSATVHEDDTPTTDSAELGTKVQKDDESSARPSTSLSESSHTGPPVDSPRTSTEDASSVTDLAYSQQAASKEETEQTNDVEEQEMKEILGKDDVDLHTGRPSEESEHDDTRDIVDDATYSDHNVEDDIGSHSEPEHLETSPVPYLTSEKEIAADAFQPETSLIKELFPPSKSSQKLDDAADDPIYSTSGRKAWYRLTRKQTMREFNTGTADDNHTRVTWLDSRIRTEVNKIVGRWAREDRLSGTGAGARASFYWDTPAPTDTRAPSGHSRTQSTLPTVSSTVQPRQSLPPLSTKTRAAFDWSSPSATTNPWDQPSSLAEIVNQPAARVRTSIDQIVLPDANSATMELLSPARDGDSQNGTVPNWDETPAAATVTAPPQPHITSPELSTNFNSLKIDTSSQIEVASATAEDEDDDWGDMVSSPTVSTPITVETRSHTTSRTNTLSTPASTPLSVKTSQPQDHNIDSMYESRIVRLKSTISPTSAIFGAKSFVPAGIEQGPIGPSILKPATRVAGNSRIDSLEENLTSQSLDALVQSSEAEHIFRSSTPIKNIRDAIKSPIDDSKDQGDAPLDIFGVPQFPEAPSSPTLEHAHAQTTIDSWADADFSFFESADPPATQDRDPSGPFSVFATPPRANKVEPTGVPFTRSPPRPQTPPPLQPLTGATNSAQRRKIEEDTTIASILRGLPDLGYMLR